jgi:hypothetical protein
LRRSSRSQSRCGLSTEPGGNHCAHGFRPTVDPSQRRGRFDGDVVEAQLAHEEKKDAGGATRWCGAGLARATRTRSAASITVRGYWAERVRLMQHWSEPGQPTRRCVRRLAARIGGHRVSRVNESENVNRRPTRGSRLRPCLGTPSRPKTCKRELLAR